MFLSKDTADIFLNEPTVVTIGTFDGVHIGHQKILERLIKSSQKYGLRATVLTFFPHPRMVLQQNVELKLINTIRERIEILRNSGIDNLIVYPFTKEFSRLGAHDYIEGILVKKLNAKRVIIGYDHRFGRNRSSDIHDLYEYGTQFGFEVEEIPEQDIDEVSVSSTKIRRALHQGNLQKANRYLGAPFILSGTVVRGRQLGRKLGYATANLQIEEDYKLIPKGGVYVVKAAIEGRFYFGMMNIGTNPTVGGKDQTIETHFFNWSGKLYDKSLQIELLQRIRDEQFFGSTQELIQAMQKDEAFSKNFIKNLKDT